MATLLVSPHPRLDRFPRSFFAFFFFYFLFFYCVLHTFPVKAPRAVGLAPVSRLLFFLSPFVWGIEVSAAPLLSAGEATIHFDNMSFLEIETRVDAFVLNGRGCPSGSRVTASYGSCT